MNSERFIFNIEKLFEKFDMTQVLAKARKADYRRVFQEEAQPTTNAGVIDGFEKPLDQNTS